MVAFGESGKLSEFKNLTLIGKGSFGKVYRAVRLSDNIEYALKELDMRPMQQREREDCVNEVRILASSTCNPYIVRYFDAFMEGESLWIVTELARGGDMDAKVKRHQKRGEYMPEDMIWNFFIQICQGLKHLHSANILHRDIKAPNIFITGPRSVKIGDMGVAKCTRSGMARTQIGTPYYMSPELWRNLPYDQKSDIWSLGVLIYEFAALKHPFQAQNERQLYERVMRGAYPPIPRCYSPELANVIRMMLTQDASKRPTTDELLALPAVQKHLESAETAMEDMIFNKECLVGTIQVPRILTHLRNRLPGSKYEHDSRDIGENGPVPTSRSSEGRTKRRKDRGSVIKSMDEGLIRRSKSEALEALNSEFFSKKHDSLLQRNRSEVSVLPKIPYNMAKNAEIVRIRRDDVLGRLPPIPTAGSRYSRQELRAFHDRRRPW
uniref:non-specific serine/threonine protein kinase n=3 Tax=Guillardia theta TaxID=55529 RepID=A0A7S4UAH0_GUITH|mmetsp:Transcript_46618/g.146156  ORF Transcript_46618/g.146156 Transcript_46618/m.146156 type:complete len:437 (+) Transcript_46618:382-1692(+)